MSKELIEHFAYLLNQEDDPSRSPYVEFFTIICKPAKDKLSNKRNQDLTVEILLSQKLDRIRQCLEHIFNISISDSTPVTGGAASETNRWSHTYRRHHHRHRHQRARTDSGGTLSDLEDDPETSEVPCEAPHKLVDILIAAISDKGSSTAQKLVTKNITSNSSVLVLDDIIRARERHMRESADLHHEHLDAQGPGWIRDLDFGLFKDPKFTTMVKLLDLQLQALGLDSRRLVGDSAPLWNVVTNGLPSILRTFAKREKTHKDTAHLDVLVAALRVVEKVVRTCSQVPMEETLRHHSDAMKMLHVETRQLLNGNLPSLVSERAHRLNDAFKASPFERKAPPTYAKSAVSEHDENGDHADDDDIDDTLSDVTPFSADDRDGYSDGAAAHLQYLGGVGVGVGSGNDNDGQGNDEDGIGGLPQQRSSHNTEARERWANLYQRVRTLTNATAPAKDGSVAEMVFLPLFEQALRDNPHIQNRLRERRYELVTELEKSGKWDWIVVRMVQFLEQRIFSKDEWTEETCIRIFDILKHHLIHARSDRGKPIPNFHMEETYMACFQERQNTLNALGVTHVVLKAISHSSASHDGSMADCAVALLLELLRGGNKEVQTTIIK